MFTNVVMDFCIISGCLLLAKGLRVGIPFFQKLHIPTAVMGGVLDWFYSCVTRGS